MTGSQTDRVQVPRWQTASALLSQLASRLFTVTQRRPADSLAGEEGFHKWYALRAMNDRIQREQSLELNEQNRRDLRNSLEYIHDLAHDTDIATPMDMLTCKCETAERIDALLMTFAEDELERRGIGERRTAAVA